MSSSFLLSFQVKCCMQERPSVSDNLHHFKTTLSTLKPLFRKLERTTLQIDVSRTIKNGYLKLLDAFVDSVFKFEDQPLLASQINFAPVAELKVAVAVTAIEGDIPDDFPEGVYIRNGPNPLFGGLKSTISVFGRSSNIWIEGEGMLHALYFDKASDKTWRVSYNNRYVETETFKHENERGKPSYIPAIEGNSAAILSACVLNQLRFGKLCKYFSNTNIFQHSGKFYSVCENHIPQRIDIHTLRTLGNWDVNGAWNQRFTAHPKQAPGTGELVTYGVEVTKPFMEVGVISADGQKLVHKADLKFNRSILCHDIGVTQRYNVILDFPLTIDLRRVLKGGPLIKYKKEKYARIGIMPRYGDADSIHWFEVEPYCTFHILNCFEDGDEVIVRGCKAHDSIIPGPDLGLNKFEWFSRRFKHIESVEENANPEDGLLFTRCYEWRLNLQSGQVKEGYLTGTEFSIEFPMINEKFTGLKNKYGYAQVMDSDASSTAGMAKFGGLCKLYFEEPDSKSTSMQGKCKRMKLEYHKFEKNTFCSGAAFVPKKGCQDEDDGWIITFVHNEDTNMSKAYIIDAKKFDSEPVGKISLPYRVPYGFHGAFMAISLSNLISFGCHLEN